MEPNIQPYRYYLKVERALSPHTAAAYCRDVLAFLEWLAQEHPAQCEGKVYGTDIAREASSADIIRYLEYRTASHLTKRSQARLISSLRSFYKWMILEGEIKDNPCDGVDMPKMGRYLPDVLTQEEVATIIDSVSLDSWQGLRDKAILEVLYGCGLRVSEAAGLKISNIFFKEGFVRIIGKGDKERLVPLGDYAATAIADYLEVRPVPAGGKSSDILFLNSRGSGLSRVSIFTMVKRQAMAAGINKEISPHTFRHSFATHLIEGKADLRVVQEMLGHESILTTEIYTHIDKASWQADVVSHHPSREADK